MERKVFVAVREGDTVRQVQIGVAVEVAGGFSLRIGELVVGGQAQAATPAKRGTLPTVFPNYGRSKGAAIAGATREDLDYYANGARRTLADPGKSRWHANEQALLDAIEAELAKGAAPAPSEPRPLFFRQSEPPAPTDDDIPF